MIPLKILITNFLSYRGNVPLNLEGVHVACLCGDNGNGKSALLDAITWALWGRARASDDEIIHLGENEMAVDLEFSARGQRYRVLRRRAKSSRRGRAGQSLLELYVATEEGFRPLTGNTIRHTQEHVTSLIRMDYDTFINSAFLLQGRADMFTTKRPAERKEVLGTILSLGVYDALTDRAREETKKADEESRRLGGLLHEIDDELSGYTDLAHSLRKTTAKLGERTRWHKERQEDLQNLQIKLQSLGSLQEQDRETERHIVQLESEVEEFNRQVTQRADLVSNVEAFLARGDFVQKGYESLLDVRGRIDEMGRQGIRAAALGEERRELETRISAVRSNLEGESRALHATIDGIRAMLQEAEGFVPERVELLVALEELEVQESDLVGRWKILEGLREGYQNSIISNKQILQQVIDLGEKLQQLVQGEGHCPLCGTPMSEGDFEDIRTRFESEKLSLEDRNRFGEEGIKRKEHDGRILREELDSFERKLRQKRLMIEGRMMVVEQGLSRANETRERMDRVEGQLHRLETELTGGKFAEEDKNALEEVLFSQSSLSYDSGIHDELQDQLTNLSHWEVEYHQLQEARRSLPRHEEDLGNLNKLLEQRIDVLDGERRKRETWSQVLLELPQVQAAYKLAGQALDQAGADMIEAQGEFASAQAEMHRLEERKRIRVEREHALRESERAQSIYHDLTAAFGKRGIQALIIEAALPELEEEANNLLGRMTDNRMSIALETQRETLRGTIVETLDIRISDELGTRNYELFSGGEAFRIDFALRVALSRLLARRAGAPLPTLFIDEGFGSQDASGRDHLIEAIGSIQDDFQCIIVITHIEELKEAFPVRIEVTKTSEGSALAIV